MDSILGRTSRSKNWFALVLFIVGLEFLLWIVSPILDGIRSLGKSRLKRLLTGAGVTASPKYLLYNAATAMDATVGGVSYGQSQ